MRIAQPRPLALKDDRTETYLDAMKKNIDPSVQLMVKIFPAMRSDRYAAVKKFCLVDNPIATQVNN